MRQSQLSDPVARALAQELVDLKRDVARLKASNRSAQLGNSSIENGTLTIYDASGQPRSMIGKQSDGTFGLGAANGEDPPRPNTPDVVPMMAGLAISWNGTFAGPGGVPGDFSYIAIHVSPVNDFIPDLSNQVGTFIRPVPSVFSHAPLDSNSDYYVKFVAYNTSRQSSEESLQSGPHTPSEVVAQAILDGIVGELALADNIISAAKLQVAAVTETKIANNSITTPKIVARAIQAAQIAVAGIIAENIAAGAITAGKVAALAITAGTIAANAINAGNIQAGAITAQKLAAQIILTSRIILGDPNGARLEMDEFGLAQYSEEGDPTFRIGQDPRGGNYLTVVDPEDPQRALAAISDDGTMAATRFAVTNGMTYKGDEISDLLLPKTNGLAGWGITVPSSPTTLNGVAWFEFEFIARPMRMYKICSAPMVMRTQGGGVVFLRFTTDGTAPTTSSPYITYSTAPTGNTVMLQALVRNNTANEVRYRIMLHVGTFSGQSTFIESTGGLAHNQMWAEDIGPDLADSSRISNGATTSPPAARRRTVSWPATWSRTWDPGIRAINEMVQGTYGGVTNRAAFGFNDVDIRSQLAGSTIHASGLYLYASHWYYNSGGFARIRTHNTPPVPSVYPGVSATRWAPKMAKPQGLWINLGVAVAQEFRDNQTKGFALDATDVAQNLLDYGRFDGAIHGGRPVFAVDFTK